MSHLETEDLLIQELGTSGLRQSGGFIVEEILNQLRFRRGREFYKEMVDNTSIIASALFRIRAFIRRVPWRIATPEGMEENETAQFWRDWVKDALDDMDHDFNEVISESLSMMVFGFAPFEQVLKLRKGETLDPETRSQFNDGLFGWRKIALRSQDSIERWIFDANDRVLAMEQSNLWAPKGSGFATIPMSRILNFRIEALKDNPEGRSMLRSSVVDYHYYKRLKEQAAIGIARDLTGMVKMEVPQKLLMSLPSTSDGLLLTEIKKMCQQIQMDERYCAVVPSEMDQDGKPTGYKLSLMASPGTRTIDIRGVIADFEKLLAIGFFSEFMLIGLAGTGAQSQHESSVEVFKSSIEFLLDTISQTFTRDGIWRLMRLNEVPREFWPRMVFSSLKKPDLAKLAVYIKDLSVSGLLTPNKRLEDHLLDLADLPVEDVGDDDPIFDSTLPTAEKAQDRNLGILSQTQIDQVMRVNQALNNNEITLEAAERTLMAALSVDAPTAQAFLGQVEFQDSMERKVEPLQEQQNDVDNSDT